MLAELLFEGGAPRHQLEAETIVDHGELAGGQRDPLPIGLRDVLAFRGWVMREPRLGRKLGDRVVEIAPTQSFQEIAGEDDSLTPSLGQALFDQVIDAPVHRVTDFGPEPTAAGH